MSLDLILLLILLATYCLFVIMFMLWKLLGITLYLRLRILLLGLGWLLWLSLDLRDLCLDWDLGLWRSWLRRYSRICNSLCILWMIMREQLVVYNRLLKMSLWKMMEIILELVNMFLMLLLQYRLLICQSLCWSKNRWRWRWSKLKIISNLSRKDLLSIGLPISYRSLCWKLISLGNIIPWT